MATVGRARHTESNLHIADKKCTLGQGKHSNIVGKSDGAARCQMPGGCIVFY